MNYGLVAPESVSAVETSIPALKVGFTLEDVLSSVLLPQATLLAGKQGCRASVSGIISLEVPDMSQFLKGGELILTTGAILQEDGTAWARWITQLADAKAAGLVVLASPFVKLIPNAAIAAADRLGLPLLAMVGWKSMVDVIRPLEQALEASREGSMLEGIHLQRRLMQLVLDGSGLEAVGKFLARQLNHSVLIEDKQFNLLALVPMEGAAESQLDDITLNKGTPVATMKAWEEDGTLKTLRKNKQPVTLPGRHENAPSRLIFPVVVNGEVFGYFSLFGTPELSESDRLLVEHAITATAIELLKQKGATENEQKMKRDFFRDLLLATTPALAETLRRRATYLGYPLTTSYWVINVEFDEVKNEEGLPDHISRLVGILNSLLSFRQAVIVNQAQGASILYPVKEGQPTPEKIRQLAAAIQQKAQSVNLGWPVSIGVGQLYPDLMSLPQAYKEAQNALKIGRSTHGGGTVTFFTDLGIYRMLLQFAQTQDPNEFFCDPLQRLIEYNQQTDKELVKTIAAFLECNGNLTETSTKLYIHRNTLKYRLERIRDITQIDLDDAENRLMLHLGLKMNQVLKYLN
jgi:purine catabolism regulator